MLSPGPSSPRAEKILSQKSVARKHIPITKKDNPPKDNDESGDVFGSSELLVSSSHDESHNTLRKDTPCEGLLGTNPVTEEGTCNGSGEVEGVGEDGPRKTLPERSGVTDDDAEPLGGIDAERETGEIIDEPNQADNELFPLVLWIFARQGE